MNEENKGDSLNFVSSKSEIEYNELISSIENEYLHEIFLNKLKIQPLNLSISTEIHMNNMLNFNYLGKISVKKK